MEQKEGWNRSLLRNMTGRTCAKCSGPLDAEAVIGIGVRRLESPDKSESLPVVFAMVHCPGCGKYDFLDVHMQHSEFIATALVAWDKFKNLNGTPDPVPTGR
jgi:hypothetical protein